MAKRMSNNWYELIPLVKFLARIKQDSYKNINLFHINLSAYHLLVARPGMLTFSLNLLSFRKRKLEFVQNFYFTLIFRLPFILDYFKIYFYSIFICMYRALMLL